MPAARPPGACVESRVRLFCCRAACANAGQCRPPNPGSRVAAGRQAISISPCRRSPPLAALPRARSLTRRAPLLSPNNAPPHNEQQPLRPAAKSGGGGGAGAADDEDEEAKKGWKFGRNEGEMSWGWKLCCAILYMLPWVDVTEKTVYFIERFPAFHWAEYFTGAWRWVGVWGWLVGCVCSVAG